MIDWEIGMWFLGECVRVTWFGLSSWRKERLVHLSGFGWLMIVLNVTDDRHLWLMKWLRVSVSSL